MIFWSLLNIVIFHVSYINAYNITEPLYFNSNDTNPWGLTISYSVDFDDHAGNFGARFTLTTSALNIIDPWTLYFQFPTAAQRILDGGSFNVGVINTNVTDGRNWYTLTPLRYNIDGSENIYNSMVFKGSYDTSQGNPSPTEALWQLNQGNNITRALFQLTAPDIQESANPTPDQPTTQFISEMHQSLGYNPMLIVVVIIPTIVGMGLVVIAVHFWLKHAASLPSKPGNSRFNTAAIV